jgi:hypothetical protein
LNEFAPPRQLRRWVARLTEGGTKLKLAIILSTLGFVALLATPIQAQLMGHGRSMSASFSYDNLSFRYNVSDDDLKNTPSWNPESEESPLSNRKALDVARIALNRFVKNADRFEVDKINLERFEPHKWVFEIAFHCWDNRCSDTSDSFTIFVKMDGSTIEPAVSPRSKDDN